MDGRGSAARFSERYPLLITESCRHTHDEFWRKTTHFVLFFANFWITHPCLWKICRKRDPCLENLGPKNPPIWAAHTRTLNMLCTPLPGTSRRHSLLYGIVRNLMVPNSTFSAVVLFCLFDKYISYSFKLQRHLCLTCWKRQWLLRNHHFPLSDIESCCGGSCKET